MIKRFVKLMNDSRGATAIEYGLIAALIAVAAIGAMRVSAASWVPRSTTLRARCKAQSASSKGGGGAARRRRLLFCPLRNVAGDQRN